jgi:hypothetical protein
MLRWFRKGAPYVTAVAPEIVTSSIHGQLSRTGNERESAIAMFALVPQTTVKILSFDERSSHFPGETEFVLIGRGPIA